MPVLTRAAEGGGPVIHLATAEVDAAAHTRAISGVKESFIVSSKRKMKG